VADVWRDEPMTYIGVDTQFFLAALLPKKERPDDIWFARSMPLRAAPAPSDKKLKKLTNVSFRVASNTVKLEPGGAVEHEFTIFAGPKKPDYLADYGLGRCIYYGWFGWVSKPMLAVLHFFYAIVRNYGISIMLLTVLVRSGMFPISRKQALNAQKMQEIQPEMKRLAEKYKGDMEKRTKAQQELFRKHNYNPLSGCLPMFLQLPIFIGLYRSLAVDVELRQATLLGRAIGWCTNLAGPDMLFRWDGFIPAYFSSPTGWLGPYFNLLPGITMALMLWQQKMFMPPPADEQAALQQKMMRFMMIFMFVIFFKVASGLCLYFIVSSSWGIAERKLLPKTKAAEPPPVTKNAKKGKKVPS